MSDSNLNLYGYNPSHAAPAVFAVLVGLSLSLHVFQCFYYRCWKVMFFVVWAGLVFTAGWVIRCIGSYNTTNLDVYIASTVMIYAGPPIFAAAEYNVLSRLLLYLPMHAPMNPNRVLVFFIYVGAAVEGLAGSGAALFAVKSEDLASYRTGETLMAASLLIQACVESVFMGVVIVVHRRAMRSGMLTRHVRTLCFMLYGTSTLVLLRCIFRAVQTFVGLSLITSNPTCNAACRVIIGQEWYLYVFEALPMVIYTWWINIIHPGRLLPKQKNLYLDIDGKTERLGPGWIEKRSTWRSILDPMDWQGSVKGKATHEEFWLEPIQWPVVSRSGSRVSSRHLMRKNSPSSV